MNDSNALNKAFRKYNVGKIASIIGKNGLRQPHDANEFIKTLRHSTCLAIQIENTQSEKLRDLLITYSRELINTCPDQDIRQAFEDHVADAKIVELGYREIFRTIHSSKIWQHPPDEQVWGVIYRAEREFILLKAASEKGLDELAENEKSVLDPRQFKIAMDAGLKLKLDAVVTGIVRNAADTLITLAYAHGWFKKDTGAIEIPCETTVNEEISFKVGSFSHAAHLWRELGNAWSRACFFNAKFRLRKEKFPVKQGGSKVTTVLESTAAEKVELMDQISLQRLEQVFFQRNQKTKSAERVAFDVLRDNYHLPVDDDSVIIFDIPFRLWIKGYAFYSRLAEDKDGNSIFSCIRISAHDLVGGLLRSGFTEHQSYKFIELTTFGRGVEDLFDAPLLRVKNGSYIFFAPAYHSPVLGVIALSRIAWLNRRRDEYGENANGNIFEGKGKAFESRVLKDFIDAGLSAKTFKYSLDKAEYECDVAVLIDKVLFVFECKNRSLPMGHIPSIYYFILGLEAAKDQVTRIAQQLDEYPEIISREFGPNAKWKRIVPVVLHALPWSSGKSDGVYFYDGSALSHLIHTGFTSIITEYKLDAQKIQRRHRYQLRKGEIPTSEELERDMENPTQLRLHSLGWKQESTLNQVSNDLVFALPQWTQRTINIEEQMVALGSSQEEANNIANEMREEIPKEIRSVQIKKITGLH